MQKDDVIYRQGAIDAIDKRVQFLKDDPVFRRKRGDIDLYGIKPIIRALPSAQPKRKTGKWELLSISTITPVYKCSACGRHAVWITTGCLVNRHEESYLSDFCPSCGADMREGK